MSVRVKICGITNRADALLAVEAGADALGFIFYEKSPRFVLPEAVAEITRDLPPFVLRVGVFVDEGFERIESTWRISRLNALQLHGAESPEFCRRLPLPVIKAFRVNDQQSLAPLAEYSQSPVSAFLLDSYAPGQLGGTGEKFNWDLAVQAQKHKRPIILAGGLTPDNVADAVATVCPYGVDVSSGVEASPGRKKEESVRAFIQRAKSATVNPI